MYTTVVEGIRNAEYQPDNVLRVLDAPAQILLRRRCGQEQVETAQKMNLHYDHPILMLQHMVWHEGYHHGQIKLALKLAGRPLDDTAIGPVTWGVWMRKTN